MASSLQSSAPKQGPLHPWMTLAQIWLHAGIDTYTQKNAADKCSGLGLFSLFVKGFTERGRLDEIMIWFLFVNSHTSIVKTHSLMLPYNKNITMS